MIDISSPFILYAECEIVYDGRAYSTLDLGNYLIVHKQDGSLSIHGSTKIPPRNYQPSKSVLSKFANMIICRSKKEKIVIIIHNILNVFYPKYWSDTDIVISRTEKQLVDKLCSNIESYLGVGIVDLVREYPTPVGPIDVAATDSDGTVHIIEAKRKRGTLANCTQLKRYVECIGENKPVRGYLACPEINESARKYIDKCGFRWLRVTFFD